MSRHFVWMFGALALVAGCLSHERPDEPDLGPDARPSDDDDGWLDPPAGSTDPCCDVGPLVGLDDATRQASQPVVAWDGESWGMAWADMPNPIESADVPVDVAFLRLDTTARALIPRAPTERIGLPTTLAWGVGRFVVGTRFTSPWTVPQRSRIARMTRDGSVEAMVEVLHVVASVTRWPGAHAWVVATFDDHHDETTEDGTSVPMLQLLGDDLLPIGSARMLERTWAGEELEVVALKSRLVLIDETSEGVRQRTFTDRDLSMASSGLITGPALMMVRGGLRTHARLSATRLRDTVITARVDEGVVSAVVFDPFADAVVAGARRVAETAGDQGLSVAADDLGGTAAICFGRGEAATRGFVLALVGPDGGAIGEPVELLGSTEHSSECTLAAAGLDRYVAIIRVTNADGIRQNVFASTVTVRR
jgi:hypothetical protein